MSADTLATIIATAVALGWLLLMVCAAVLIGHLFAGPPEVMVADTFAEHEDEPVEVDGPTSRLYIHDERLGRSALPPLPESCYPPDAVALPVVSAPLIGAEGPANPQPREEFLVTKPKPEFHPLCFEAYCDRRYSDICKGCTPRMGVRP